MRSVIQLATLQVINARNKLTKKKCTNKIEKEQNTRNVLCTHPYILVELSVTWIDVVCFLDVFRAIQYALHTSRCNGSFIGYE